MKASISVNVVSKPTRNLLANNRLLLVLWLVEHFGARPFCVYSKADKSRSMVSHIIIKLRISGANQRSGMVKRLPSLY